MVLEQFNMVGSSSTTPRSNHWDRCASLLVVIVRHYCTSLIGQHDSDMKLGQDPLREDADKELVFNEFSRRKKSIGALLMDQSIIAGVGNIYRSEILWHAG